MMKIIITIVFFLTMIACSPKINPSIVKHSEDVLKFAQLARDLQVNTLACIGVECEDLTPVSKTPMSVWHTRHFRNAYGSVSNSLDMYKKCPSSFNNGTELTYATDYLYDVLLDMNKYIKLKMLEDGRCIRRISHGRSEGSVTNCTDVEK